MAGAGGFLADMNDHWLKLRLLRVVVSERLPQLGTNVPPAELASILQAVRTHGLLTESLPGPPDPKLAEAWCATVDAWVERVVELVESDSIREVQVLPGISVKWNLLNWITLIRSPVPVKLWIE